MNYHPAWRGKGHPSIASFIHKLSNILLYPLITYLSRQIPMVDLFPRGLLAGKPFEGMSGYLLLRARVGANQGWMPHRAAKARIVPNTALGCMSLNVVANRIFVNDPLFRLPMPQNPACSEGRTPAQKPL